MKKRLGEILVESGIVSTATIDKAIQEKKPNQKIGDFLVEKGFVKEEILYTKLSEQLKIPLIRLNDIDLKSNALDKIPMDLLIEHTAFPVELSGSLLTVAMSDPLDDAAIKDFEETVNLDISPVLGVKSEIIDYIDKYYNIDNSMQDLFGIREESIDGINETQIADLLFGYVKKYHNMAFVVGDIRGALQLQSGNVPEMTPNDTKYILTFIKKVVGYNEQDNEFSVLFKGIDNLRIAINLLVIRKYPQTEYWIDVRLIEDVQNINKGAGLFNTIKSSGIYVVYNPKFKNIDKFRNELVAYQENSKQRILVHTNDLYFESLKLHTIQVGLSELPKFDAFCDTFVLDFGWELDNVDPLLRLLKDGKRVILHVPFENKSQFIEYLSSKGLETILSSFITEHISLERF